MVSIYFWKRFLTKADRRGFYLFLETFFFNKRRRGFYLFLETFFLTKADIRLTSKMLICGNYFRSRNQKQIGLFARVYARKNP